jgi:hypothetical protein
VKEIAVTGYVWPGDDAPRLPAWLEEAFVKFEWVDLLPIREIEPGVVECEAPDGSRVRLVYHASPEAPPA